MVSSRKMYNIVLDKFIKYQKITYYCQVYHRIREIKKKFLIQKLPSHQSNMIP
eukprot:UN27775